MKKYFAGFWSWKVTPGNVPFMLWVVGLITSLFNWFIDDIVLSLSVLALTITLYIPYTIQLVRKVRKAKQNAWDSYIDLRARLVYAEIDALKVGDEELKQTVRDMRKELEKARP